MSAPGPASVAPAPRSITTFRRNEAERWARLSRSIAACTQCPLHLTRNHPVIYRGSLRPRIVFVGEAPGAEEDRLGVPFVGRSGSLLDEAIEQVGLSPADFGVLNLVKCRPPENRFIRSAAATCRPFLDQQLVLLAPELLVTLGAHALRAFVPEVVKITEVAGAPLSARAYRVFPMLHPAAMMHAPRLRERWEHDVASLADYLSSPRPQAF